MNEKINQYIGKISPLGQGDRNNGLHRAGLQLRRKFDLSGDALESVLSEVNQTKCAPPLPNSEVATIARSVNKADVSKGQKKSHSPTYFVSAAADPTSAGNLLQKNVSVYSNCLEARPAATMTIGEILEKLRTGGSVKELIDAVRNETDKDKRNELKIRLPAILFGSDPQEERKAALCQPNGIFVLDFDNIPPEELDTAKEKIAAVDYVFAVFVSVSGKGLFALAAYEGTPNLKTLLAAMQADFCYDLDKHCSDVSRLRIVTQDENLIVKNEVYPAILIEETGGEEQTLKWVPFPVDVFPESLRNYIIESAAALNVDPAYVGPFSLAVIASVIGSSIRIQLKSGWQEPSIIWTVLVACSGSGKSPGLDAAVEPLRTIQKKADKRHIEAESEHEKQLAVYNAKVGQWKKKPDSRPPEKPLSPILEAYIVDDTTPEALLEILEQNPFDVCLPKDELSSWLGGFDAYNKGKSSKDLPFWLAMHGGRYYRVNRKSTGQKISVATTPAISICGGIQPGILSKILKENEHYFDAGLAARILFAMPPDQSQRWTNAVVSEATKNRYQGIIDRIHSWQSYTDDNPLNPENPDVLTLSESAQEAFIAFYNANAEERERMESETQKAFWPKLTGYAARIALVFHVVKKIDGHVTDYDTIDGETMESAIRLVQWHKRESLRIVQAMRGEAPQIDTEATDILDVLRRKAEPLTAREVGQLVNSFHGKGGTERCERKLREMVVEGTLLSAFVKGDNGGRGKTVYWMVTYGTSENTGENGSSVDVDSVEEFANDIFTEFPTEASIYGTPENTGENGCSVDVDGEYVYENDFFTDFPDEPPSPPSTERRVYRASTLSPAPYVESCDDERDTYDYRCPTAQEIPFG